MTDISQLEIEAELERLTDDEKDTLRLEALAIVARTYDSPQGFSAFYELIHGRPLDPEILRDFIEPIYDNKEQDMGTLTWAARGFYKTTTITVTWGAFRIGHNPYAANLIVQANDDTAGKNSKQIADIIENNEGFHMAFPFIEPDKERGWGAQGYEVWCRADTEILEDGRMRFTEIDYKTWRTRNSQRKDPSLVGLGYRSGSLIGMHPDGFLIVDDIHDEDNTKSEVLVNEVIKKITDTVFPMVVENGDELITWVVFVGTPWTEDDVYHYIRDTGEYGFVFVPVMRKVAKGTEGAIEINHLNLQGWFVLTRPDQFGVAAIIRSYNKSGHRGFFRMFLLSLEAANDTGLKYTLFPADLVDAAKWISLGGVDYASILESKGRTQKNRSFFAFLYGAIRPTGGMVIFDGVVEQITQVGAESKIHTAQNLYPFWQHTYFEADGVGEQAIVAMLTRNPELKIVPMKTQGKSKRIRSETELAPLLETGKIMISDADTPALRMLRNALDKYPHGLSDPVDALYWVARAGQDMGAFPSTFSGEIKGSKKRKKSGKHPFNMRQTHGIS